MNQIEFKIEKETKWDSNKKETKTVYYVWAGHNCVEVAYTEEQAEEAYEKVKANWRPSSTEVLKREWVEVA
jgi:hypothetical protein